MMAYTAHNLNKQTMQQMRVQVRSMIRRQPGITPLIIALQTELRSHEAWTVCYALLRDGEISTKGRRLTGRTQLYTDAS